MLLGERAQAESCLRELVQARPMAQARATAWAKRHGLHLAYPYDREIERRTCELGVTLPILFRRTYRLTASSTKRCRIFADG